MEPGTENPSNPNGASSRREIEVISLVGFAHGTSHFYHFMLPPLFPWLMRDFGLTFTQAGTLSAAFFVVSGGGQALAGFLVDRVGARRVLLAGMSLFAMAALTLGLAGSYPVLLLAAALAGAGNSVFHPADFTLLNRNVSPRRLGHAFSVHGLSGNLGWALGPVVMAGLAVAADWRTAAFAAAVPAAIGYAVIVGRGRTMAELPVAAGVEPDGPPAQSLFAFLGSPTVWTCFLFFCLVTMAFGGLQNYAPPLLHNLHGMSLAAGASALTAFLLAGAAGMVFGGFLVARGGSYDRNIALVLATGAGLVLVIASADVPPWGVVALMAGAGWCYGAVGPSRDMLVRYVAASGFGHGSFGRVYGFVYAGLDTGLAVAPLIFGPLMDAGRFALALVVVALLQLLAVLAAWQAGRQARGAPALSGAPVPPQPANWPGS